MSDIADDCTYLSSATEFSYTEVKKNLILDIENTISQRNGSLERLEKFNFMGLLEHLLSLDLAGSEPTIETGFQVSVLVFYVRLFIRVLEVENNLLNFIF